MIEKKIKLPTIESVKEFISIAHNCPADIDLYSDRYVIDGKSIMGIFSLNLSKTLNMRINEEDDKLFLPFKKFEVQN